MTPTIGDEQIRKAARDIALRCRRVVEKALPSEDVGRADWEFAAIAEVVIRELPAVKGAK